MVRKIYLSIAFLGIVFMSLAQEVNDPKLKKADHYYTNFSFDKAIEKYEELGDKDLNSQRNLALSYMNTRDYVKAEELFSEIVKHKDALAEDLYNYASVLEINKNYEEAEQWMTQFSQENPADYRAINYMENKNSYAIFQMDKKQFSIDHPAFNTEQEDFGTAYYKDLLLFASTRKKVPAIKREWNWNSLPFLSIYQVAPVEKSDQETQTEDKEWQDPKPFYRRIDKKYHDGPVAFNKEETKMYLTRNNYENKSEEGIVKLQLFTTQMQENGKWSSLEAFPYNSSEYSVAHASITYDGKCMYFASDMPGGFGGADLYKVSIKEDGSYGKPENLGARVNTEANEMFPFIHESGILFFASDGLAGLGGLDVFYIKVNRNGRLGDVQNMGYPINTNKDDFAFMLNKYSSEGYFSSNRDGGKGDDDIYSFELLKPFEFTKLLRGTSLEQDGDTIPFAFISLYSEEGVLIDSVMSDSIGAYEFVVLADKLYTLKGEKASYFDGRNSADTHVDEEIIIVDLVLLQDIKVLAEIIEINPIYFDFDKSNIRPDAAIELDKIVEVMNKYDSLVVELGSHTDCRGSKAYNEQLSDRRAKSSAKYIKARITNPERITGKGYGEYRLLNGCECEGDVQSDCSKEDHQMNRRTEFRVIKEGAHKVKIETKGPNSFDEIETPEE